MPKSVEFAADESNPDIAATTAAFRARYAPIAAALGNDPDLIIEKLEAGESVTFREPIGGIYRVDMLYIERITRDLGYLETFWGEGLSGLNRRLSRLLAKIKAGGEAEETHAAVESLNDLLGAAIYLFPHGAAGVAIRIRPETPTVLAASADLRLRSAADSLTTVRDLVGEKTTNDGTYVTTNLPYDRKPKRSMERTITASNIFLGMMHIKAPRPETTPFLALRLISGRGPAIIPVSLLDAVAFTNDEALTPFVSEDRGTRELIPEAQAHPIEHYLAFRNFSSYGDKRNRDRDFAGPEHRMDDRIWNVLAAGLLEPHTWDTLLWDVGYTPKGHPVLRHGFLAVVPEHPGGTTLVEFKDAMLARSYLDRHLAQADLADLVLSNTLRPYARFWGMDVIRRLAAVPVIHNMYLVPGRAVVSQQKKRGG